LWLFADAQNLCGQIGQSATGKRKNNKTPIGPMGHLDFESENRPDNRSKAKSPQGPDGFSFCHGVASIIDFAKSYR
jgi:hypothetical protein